MLRWGPQWLPLLAIADDMSHTTILIVDGIQKKKNVTHTLSDCHTLVLNLISVHGHVDHEDMLLLKGHNQQQKVSPEV